MKPILELKNISKVYGSGHTAVKAVDQVNLVVNPSEIILVMGPSGSGKTTLLSVAGLLLRPSAGQIWMNGTEITGMNERQLPELRLRNIGFVFQAYNLLSALSARENVELVINMAGVRGKEARQRAAELLMTLGLEHRI
ncbi:MAG: ATP-binding cassette domain-containing protein, partial [Anaerolineae bacterium]|nr:ATP-binding cassette domain-containing protein [Anaerolineae bacterium]